MFSLDNTMRYWLYNKPVNMRMGFNGLSGIVNNSMGMNMRNGDVFVFVNAARNRMKILHRKSTSMQLATTLSNFEQLCTTCRYFLKLAGSSGKLYLYVLHRMLT